MNEMDNEQDLVSVFEAPNEIAALAVRDALQAGGSLRIAGLQREPMLHLQTSHIC